MVLPFASLRLQIQTDIHDSLAAYSPESQHYGKANKTEIEHLEPELRAFKHRYIESAAKIREEGGGGEMTLKNIA